MRPSWLRVGAPSLAAMLLAIWIGAGLVSAQGTTVRINGAIDKLVRGKSLAGAIMYDFSLYAAAQFASSDLDFIIIDMEHRGLDFERLETFLLGTTNKAEIAKQGNLQVRVPPIVRIPTYGRSPNEAIVKQVLDMGAFGIMFPAIENKEQAIQAVAASRYPQMKGSKYPTPVGRRGNGNMPAAWFWGLSRPEYSLRADVWPANPNGELLLFLQIETVEGVKNVEEILSVPGIGVRVRRTQRLVVVARSAAGLTRTQRGGADGAERRDEEKHSSGYHGYRGRRRQQAEAGLQDRIAAERRPGSADGCDAEAGTDGHRTRQPRPPGNISDLRRLAKRRLPRVVFDYIDGGADAEVTLRDNVKAYEELTFRPRGAVAIPSMRFEDDDPAASSSSCRSSWRPSAARRCSIRTAKCSPPARRGRREPATSCRRCRARRWSRSARRRADRPGIRCISAAAARRRSTC